jgi:hypothetical protein
MDKDTKNLIADLTIEVMQSGHNFFTKRFKTEKEDIPLGILLNVILNSYMTAMLELLTYISEAEPSLNGSVRRFASELVSFLEREGLAQNDKLQ